MSVEVLPRVYFWNTVRVGDEIITVLLLFRTKEKGELLGSPIGKNVSPLTPKPYCWAPKRAVVTGRVRISCCNSVQWRSDFAKLEGIYMLHKFNRCRPDSSNWVHGRSFIVLENTVDPKLETPCYISSQFISILSPLPVPLNCGISICAFS